MKCNTKILRELLSSYPSNAVNIYIDYVITLNTKRKKKKTEEGKEEFILANKWATYLDTNWYFTIFEKVARDGIYIDGESISITKRGATYDYNAYKTILLLKYPETKLDVGLVYNVDKFTFHKENGKISYRHTINDPFSISNSKKIIGAYAIVKNRRGEFLETINLNDIDKFKNSAEIDTIWETWYDRMVLKSVIKRVCKIGFYDIFKNIEQIDNQNSNPDNGNVSSKLRKKIAACINRQELNKLWRADYMNDRQLVKIFKEKAEQIDQQNKDKKQKKVIDNKHLKIAIGKIISGSLDKYEFLENYELSDLQKKYFEEAENV